MDRLTDEQKATVAGWINAGDGLADVQRKLQQELDVNMTYMETRFLVDDLNLQLQDQEKEAPADLVADPDGAEPAPAAADPALAGGGSVSVTIDQVTQPQALVSGKVTFSDGKKASWMLDQMGRLALDPETPGYRPSESDVMEFQKELQRVATSQGL